MKVNYPLLIMFLLSQAIEFAFFAGVAALLGMIIPIEPFYIFVIIAAIDIVVTGVLMREQVTEFLDSVFPEDD